MRKVLALVFLTSLFASCIPIHIQPFFHFPIVNDGGSDSLLHLFEESSITISESHPNATGDTQLIVSSGTIMSSGYSSGGSDPNWVGVPDPGEQSEGLPLYMLYYLPYLLLQQEVSLVGSGVFTSEYFVPYSVSYSSREIESVPLPYSAVGGIHSPPTDTITATDLHTPGTLYRLDFQVGSENPYIAGDAMMILSTGYPNGLLYLVYDHDTAYTTVAYQQTGGGSSGSLFSDGYRAEYDWILFEDGTFETADLTLIRAVWEVSANSLFSGGIFDGISTGGLWGNDVLVGIISGGSSDSVRTIWQISEDGVDTVSVSESHPNGDGETHLTISGGTISASGFGSGGSDPNFSGVPGPGVQSDGLPMYMLFYLPFILLQSEVSLVGSGNFDSEYFVPYTVDYVSASIESVALPYLPPGGIHSGPTDTLRRSELYSPGDLYRIDFEVASANPYIGGSAMMVLSTGYPNGMLYLVYDHDTAYTTVAYQQTGGGASGALFATDYTAEYDWFIVADGSSL